MAIPEDDNIKIQTQRQSSSSRTPLPAPTTSSLSSSTPTAPGPSRALWPGLARLLRGADKQKNEETEAPGAMKANAKDHVSHKSKIPTEEIAMDLIDSSNGKFSILARAYQEPSTGTASDVPSYFSNVPFQDDTILSGSSQSIEPNLVGWDEYPPRTAPRFDLADPTASSKKGLRDLEEFIDEHIKQSTALRDWVEKTNEKRVFVEDPEADQDTKQDRSQTKILEMYQQLFINAPNTAIRTLAEAKVKEIVKEIDDAISPTRKAAMEHDKALASEILETYAAFVDVKKCESQASSRRHALEVMDSPQPRQELSRVECLLGSDGSAPSTAAITKEKRLYFVGSPPKLTKMPFDQAVKAGLEDIHNPLKPRPLSLPSASRPKPRRMKPSTSDVPFVFESSSSSSLSPPPSQPPFSLIPDWFVYIKLPLKGREVEDRYQDLLKRFGGLHKAVHEDGQQGKEKKSTWGKNWHEPNPAWPYPHWQRSGGWWRCRDGPEASKAEKDCHVCLASRTAAARTPPAADPKEELEKLTNAINEAMAKVAKKDKAIALEVMRQADEERDSEEGSHASSLPNEATIDNVPPYRQNYSLLRGYDSNL
ncbi:hypothetical protein GGS26DRAFT_464018 [Hypomontagnella submonticulosa]|nr:hypothetical protein GGS26DRAFT_464018 [Hypomontagnella submonticulosa]